MTSLPPISVVYLAFFGVSLVVLLLIACVKLPEAVRGLKRFTLQTLARRTRRDRMLADLEQLIADARQLEGVYRFDTVESPGTPCQAEAGATVAATASMSSRVAAR
ncbi:MAG: hypothetical protein GXX91_09405 [Verrucomicrobiaceae bacterium]|nr:hypothetical protein [Verrucomicrobiaceae bacterium]